jgi:hypothetical protein
MVFTINADGTFIGIDSNIFAGASHSTAHGQWASVWPWTIQATFTLLQQGPNGVFVGGFKNLFSAQLADSETMTGQIDAYLYSYTNADGSAIVGADGLPTPSPLDAPSLCGTTSGCQHLGIFTFKARRVSVQW